jgi:hypothetical protein
MKRKTIAERIRAYTVAHPDAKPKEVADAVKCNVSNVYALRYKKVEPLKAEQIKAEPTKADWTTIATTTSKESFFENVNATAATAAFLVSVLTREELVGAYKVFRALNTAAIDLVSTNAYSEWLREVLSPAD